METSAAAWWLAYRMAVNAKTVELDWHRGVNETATHFKSVVTLANNGQLRQPTVHSLGKGVFYCFHLSVACRNNVCTNTKQAILLRVFFNYTCTNICLSEWTKYSLRRCISKVFVFNRWKVVVSFHKYLYRPFINPRNLLHHDFDAHSHTRKKKNTKW